MMFVEGNKEFNGDEQRYRQEGKRDWMSAGT